MAHTYFCIGSYYQGWEYQKLLEHLQTLDFPSYNILVNEQRGCEKAPRGFAATLNPLVCAAFADPECKVAWILNDDILPDGEALRNVQQLLLFDRHVGVAAPLPWYRDYEGFKWVRIGTKEVPLNERPRGIRETMACGFACAAISREAWRAVGPMDESLGRGYCEDTDWGLRCWQAGFANIINMNETFYHQGGGTFNRLVKEGKFRKEEPMEAASQLKKKWPFLWEEPEEAVLERCHTWRAEALIKEATNASPAL